MAAVVWFTMAVALWHFTVFLPDRFWAGIVGALLGAIAGGMITGRDLPNRVGPLDRRHRPRDGARRDPRHPDRPRDRLRDRRTPRAPRRHRIARPSRPPAALAGSGGRCSSAPSSPSARRFPRGPRPARSTSRRSRIASNPTFASRETPRVPRRSRSPSTVISMRSVSMPIDAATIWQVTWAQAASAPSRRSPEQAAVPGPPTPACAWAAWIAWPASTEQATGVSVSLALATRVIRASSGSSR